MRQYIQELITTYHEINKRKVEIICDRYTRTYTYHEINKRKIEILCDRYTRTYTAGKPVTQESSLDVFCHVIFDVNIDVMDVLRNLLLYSFDYDYL